MSTRVRLDSLLVQRDLAVSVSQAQALVLAGVVMVDGQPARKPGARVASAAQLSVRERPPYVSRGGLKLAAALEAFCVSPRGLVCADVGASTGGFTDCLLQHGAARVYAIDVGYGQLAWSLRQDGRVVVMERTNARYLSALPEPVGLVTLDASFISLDKLLPVVVGWLTAPMIALPLIKPQFEAGQKQVGRGGVVRDRAVHRQVLEQVVELAVRSGLRVWGVMRSPLTGPAGNVEFMMYLRAESAPSDFDVMAAVEKALDG